MTSRIVFSGALEHAMRIRALTRTDVATRAGVCLATVSRAVTGLPVNLTTALRIARAVSACAVVAELEEWGRDPPRRWPPTPRPPLGRAAVLGRRPPAAPSGPVGKPEQLRIGLD